LARSAEEVHWDRLLLVPGPAHDVREWTGFTGRWLVLNELVVTAVALLPSTPEFCVGQARV
jgi:hypothetical protein